MGEISVFGELNLSVNKSVPILFVKDSSPWSGLVKLSPKLNLTVR